MAVVVMEQPGQNTETVIIRPRFDFMHFKTPHGILLIVQFIIGIILLAIGAPVFVYIIAWIAWIVSHLLIWIYLFSYHDRFSSTPPLQVVEFYFNVIACLFYGICVLNCFFVIAWISGIFAVINTIAYGASAFFLLETWNAYRAGPK